jgi:opacity protein-like surface antigen
MKCGLILLLCGAGAIAQPFHFGVKAGLPLTDLFHAGSATLNTAGSSAYLSSTKRYTVGATAEIRLPLHLSLEADLLYKRLGYDSATSRLGASSISSTTANSWELPILAKYHLRAKGTLNPFVGAGISFHKATGVNQNTQTKLVTFPPVTRFSTTDLPTELIRKSNRGFVAAAGLEIKVPLLRITPEIRYTHWGSDLFNDVSGLLHSNSNQADFLLGITF